jgi:uncharacterized membrane protein
MPNAANFFTSEQKTAIEKAIKDAEARTSGEIRVHIEQVCKEDVLDHAVYIFETLEMQKTKLRNGVLIYLSVDDHKMAIIGDLGINTKVPENFWDEIRDKMISHFKEGRYTEGLIEGIHMSGEALKKYFPVVNAEDNELSNEISFGKNRKEAE